MVNQLQRKLHLWDICCEDYLFPWKTIEENIMLGLHIRKIYDEQMKEHTLNLLKQVGLHGVEGQYPRELSGGMRQRLLSFER